MTLEELLGSVLPDVHDRLQYSLSTSIQHASIIFGLHFILWLLGEKLKLLEKYRIQTGPPKQGSQPPLLKVVSVVLTNHVLNFFLCYFLWQPILASGIQTGLKSFHLFTFAWQFLMCFLLEDTIFYWTHRMLHHRSIYKYVHKLHHEYRRPSVLSSEYTHPLEFVTGNVIATMAGALLCCHYKLGGGMHEYTLTLWLAYRIFETADGHCGFALPIPLFPLIPFIPSHPGVKPHDYHHSHNVGNYGSQLNFWDTVCNTYRGTIEKPVRREAAPATTAPVGASPTTPTPEPHKSKGQ
jgi:methylsterol monooxygenase/4-alpha-methyl-delta7-sterol-4alpha-methyl oxidase